MNLLWCQVFRFYCTLRKNITFYSVHVAVALPEGKDVHIQQHIHQKDLNLCLTLYCYGKVIVELEKTRTRNLTVLMVIVLWPSNTLKFLFVFGFNWCLWEIFSLNLENFWFYIWVSVVWLLILQHRWFYVTSYPCPWIKNLSAKTTKYIPKCWKRSVKRKSNLSFINHEKFIFWSTFSICVWLKAF